MNAAKARIRYTVAHQDEWLELAAFRPWLGSLERLVVSCTGALFTKRRSEAQIVVLCHAFSAIHVSPRDVALLPFPGKVRLVLFLRQPTYRAINGGDVDFYQSPGGQVRVLAVDPVPGVYSRLVTELQRVTSADGEAGGDLA